MEAALRTAYELITKDELPTIEFNDVRGLKGIKSAEIDIKGTKVKLAVANGLGNAWKLLKRANDYHFIEIMACKGGCIGGGQPIPRDPDVLQKRKNGLYKDDKNIPRPAKYSCIYFFTNSLLKTHTISCDFLKISV